MNNQSRPTATNTTNEKRLPESINVRVMKSVSEYNRQLNQERNDDRRMCMDLQSYTIQYPVGLGRENKGLRWWIKRRRRISSFWRGGRRYPVALLPTQYQDWFLSYSSHELKYFPLNTVTHGPTLAERDKPAPLLDVGSNSDSDLDGSEVLSDLDDDSACSCGEEHCAPINKTGDSASDARNAHDNSRLFVTDDNCPSAMPFLGTAGSSLTRSSHLDPNMPSLITIQHDPIKQSDQCKVCKRDTSPGDALRCADCGAASHPSCLEIGGELLQAIRLYKWQCMDCKSCNQCGEPHDEAKMMFCDKCDRGYHTYCVGLTTIPEGHWVCALCAFCANCGSKDASPSSLAVQWQHELIKIHSPDGQTMIRHQVFCESCYQLRKI